MHLASMSDPNKDSKQELVAIGLVSVQKHGPTISTSAMARSVVHGDSRCPEIPSVRQRKFPTTGNKGPGYVL